MQTVKSCTICGASFSTPYPHCITCSPNCRRIHANRLDKARHKRNMAARGPLVVTAICKRCGKEFIRKHSSAKYCSKDCYRAAMKEVQARVNKEEGARRKKVVTNNVVKLRACPLCGKLRESTWAGDRYHESCRDTAGRRSSAFN